MSLFRHAAFITVLLLLAGFGRPSYAQLPATALESLAVDLWPDYDQPDVLVLLTGALPAAAVLPASVTIPLPPGATLHAVARITSDNVMTDDVQYTQAEDSVTFTTPDSRFRVEYYMPYEAAGNQRTFTFSWLANLMLNEIDVIVQQPAAATSLQTQPTAVSVSTNSRDGLTYHALPPTAVAANQPYTVQVTYTMNQPTLTVQQTPPTDTTAVPPTTGGFDWPLLLAIAGGILVLIAIVWQVAGSRQKAKRPRKTSPQRSAPPPPAPQAPASPPAAPTTAQFCHTCGSPVQPEDKFCGNCGTAVKNR